METNEIVLLPNFAETLKIRCNMARSVNTPLVNELNAIYLRTLSDPRLIHECDFETEFPNGLRDQSLEVIDRLDRQLANEITAPLA